MPFIIIGIVIVGYILYSFRQSILKYQNEHKKSIKDLHDRFIGQLRNSWYDGAYQTLVAVQKNADEYRKSGTGLISSSIKEEDTKKIMDMYKSLIDTIETDFSEKISSACNYVELYKIVKDYQLLDAHIIKRYRTMHEYVSLSKQNEDNIRKKFAEIQNKLNSGAVAKLREGLCGKNTDSTIYDKIYTSRYGNVPMGYEKIVHDLEYEIEEQKKYIKFFEESKLKPYDNAHSIMKIQKAIEDVKKLEGKRDESLLKGIFYMIKDGEYGKCNLEFYKSVTALDDEEVNGIVNGYMQAIVNLKDFESFQNVLAIDFELLAKCLWHIAMKKPFVIEQFNNVVRLYGMLYQEKQTYEIFIAELYYAKQMGGDTIVRNKVLNFLNGWRDIKVIKEGETLIHTSSEMLAGIASALMWMGAYDSEKIVLEYMLSQQMEMSYKLQERLHSLNNGGGNAPKAYDVSETGRELYFDVSAVTWNDEQYKGFFENLSFEEKTLNYSMAVRDDDKEITAMKKIVSPNQDNLYEKINGVFKEEYGDVVNVSLMSCVALAVNNQEKIQGILVQSNECKQLGILAHVAMIGKKLNIKFYTLYMPQNNNLDEQKQQILSMAKKMSPSIIMWENSMKDNILIAIQQLLNEIPESSQVVEDKEIEF